MKKTLLLAVVVLWSVAYGNASPAGVQRPMFIASAADLERMAAFADRDPTEAYRSNLDTTVTITAPETIPANLTLIFGDGGRLVRSGQGALRFEGSGVPTGTKAAIFVGFAPGAIRWTGTPPDEISAAWWDTGNDSLTDRLDRADKAVADGTQTTINASPGTITGTVIFRRKRLVVFAPGNYPNINTSNVGFIRHSGDLTLRGSGARTRIQESAGVHPQGILPNDLYASYDNVVVEDLTFYNNPEARYDDASSTVLLGNVRNGWIRRCTFDRVTAYAAGLGGYGDKGNYSQGGGIVDCTFINCATQVAFLINSQGATIARNRFDARDPNVGPGSVIDLEPNTSHDVLENITVEDNTIDLRNANANQYPSGICVHGYPNAKNITIRNNKITAADLGSDSAGQMTWGISGTAWGFTIEGNQMIGGYQSQINFAGRDGVIQGNTLLQGSDVNGLNYQLVISGHDITVGKNVVRKTGKGTNQRAGVYEGELFWGVTSSGPVVTTLRGTGGAILGGNGLPTDTPFLPYMVGLEVRLNNKTYTIQSRADSNITLNSSAGSLAPITFAASAIDTSTGAIELGVRHNFATGARVVVSTTGSLPVVSGGYPAYDPSAGDVVFLYVIAVGPTRIKLAPSLSAALSGTALNFSGRGNGTNTITPILESVFSNNQYVGNEAEVHTLRGRSTWK